MKESKELRSYIMSRIRKTNTKPELLVRRFLFRNGFRFRINVKTLPGHPDIVLPKYNTIIMVNGCFWHAHEGCRLNRTPKSRQEYWIPKIEGNVKRDKLINKEQTNLGWKVIIVWECQLKKQNFETTLNTVIKNIKNL